MDFFLGALAFLQMTFLPGLVLYRLFKIQTTFFDRVLMVFGLSLIANYVIVFLLALAGIYTRISIAVLVLAEVAAILWYFREELESPFESFLDSMRAGIHTTIGFFFPGREQESGSVLRYFVGILLLLLAARNILWVVNIFIQNLGTVFSAWDAVVSWNRWATVWASNSFPLDSRFYPQLIPINWSIAYVMLGSPTLQFFTKALMPVFGIMMMLGFLSLSIQTKHSHFLISLIVLQPLLKTFLESGMSDGYVDIAVAFFTFATLYMLLRARDMVDIKQRSRLYLLGALFSAAAAVTKQPGVYIALCYPILVWINLFPAKSAVDKRQWIKLISAYTLVSLLWVSWYVFKAARLYMGVDPAALDVYVSLSADKYDSASLVQQILTAIGQYREFVVLFILVALAFPWMDRFYKVLALLFAPYPILWAWMASYDTRNLAIFLPVLALISGVSIYRLLDAFVRFSESLRLLKIRTFMPLAVVLLGLLYLNLVASPQRLEQRQVDLQKQIFSPAKNELLYELVEANGPETLVLTNYPMNYLPGLEQHRIDFDFDDFDQFVAHLGNLQIKYILLPNAAGDRVKDYIDEKVAAGDYEVIVRDRQWKTYTLIRIINRD